MKDSQIPMRTKGSPMMNPTKIMIQGQQQEGNDEGNEDNTKSSKKRPELGSFLKPLLVFWKGLPRMERPFSPYIEEMCKMEPRSHH
jgi:hypothetical protein